MSKAPKPKLSASPLARMAAGELDKAMQEIDAIRSALDNVSGAAASNAQALLERAYRQVGEARALAIEAFESNRAA